MVLFFTLVTLKASFSLRFGERAFETVVACQGEAKSHKNRWNSCSSPRRGGKFSGSCHSTSLPRVFLGGVFFFSLISNKAEMTVCGNCRGEGGFQCCVLSLKISLVCVLLYTFHQPPITTRTWDVSSLIWLDGFRGSLLMLGIIKLLVFGHVKEQNDTFICLCFPLFSTALCLSLPFPVSLAPPFLRLPLNPSASCRSVRLPVSVPIRFHLIHVTSINTQSSPDKSRPLSPPSASPVLLCITQFFPTSLLCHSRRPDV